jgi:phage nucleotide-binding protein
MGLAFKEAPTGKPTANVLLYGPPKTGKTAGAGSAPGEILYVNADLENASRIAHTIAGSRMNEVDLDKDGALKAILDIVPFVQEPNSGIDTVVVDPLSDLYRRLLDDVSQKAMRPTLPQRGDVTTYLERFCRALCNAPVNVVFVAHELVLEGEGEQVTKIVPYTGTSRPTLGNKIAGMVDVVGYTERVVPEQGEAIYAAHIVQENGHLGGDRFDVLGPIRRMNLTEWLDLIADKTSTNTTAGAEPEKEQTAA